MSAKSQRTSRTSSGLRRVYRARQQARLARKKARRWQRQDGAHDQPEVNFRPERRDVSGLLKHAEYMEGIANRGRKQQVKL